MFEMLIGIAVMLGVPTYIVLQIRLPRQAKGGWRMAMFAPLLIAVPDALFCIFALFQGSNLWPLTFMFFAPLAVAYLAVVEITRRIADGTL